MANGSLYEPDRGHFVYVDFDPQAGHEQAGRRPGLVLSGLKFNSRTGLAFIAPITNTVRGGPFEVPVPTGMRITGVVLVAHARSLDWKERKVQFVGVAPVDLTEEVCGKVGAIIEC